jgi:hypothetical protein
MLINREDLIPDLGIAEEAPSEICVKNECLRYEAEWSSLLDFVSPRRLTDDGQSRVRCELSDDGAAPAAKERTLLASRTQSDRGCVSFIGGLGARSEVEQIHAILEALIVKRRDRVVSAPPTTRS